ncbi:50S ribosomal protein L15 [Physcia stellaris]|nr:50S ribosomal protein L15 [Physcia stellaris]
MQSPAIQSSEPNVEAKGGGSSGGLNRNRNKHLYIKPQPVLSSGNDDYFRGGASEDLSTLFDFDSPLTVTATARPSLSKELSFGLSDGWDPLALQPLSPPDSDVYPASNWRPFDQHQHAPLNILTHIDPSRARSQYGQTTPPDDEQSTSLDSELLIHERQGNPFYLEDPSNAAEKKNKQSHGAHEPSSRPTKRAIEILERNRVAASKCRQKKKEWTNNMENRARQLQRDNASLRQMVDSCKEEIIFLKGEMLRHSSCRSTEIQDYLQRGNQSFQGSFDGNIKQEPSPMCTAPNSPTSSPLHVDRSNPTKYSSNITRAFSEEPLRRSSVSEETLERLLTSQFVHDTSEKGIAQRLNQ